MPFKITCPGCQKTLKAEEKLIGRRVKCPNCQTPIDIVAPVETPPPPPPAEVDPFGQSDPTGPTAPNDFWSDLQQPTAAQTFLQPSIPMELFTARPEPTQPTTPPPPAVPPTFAKQMLIEYGHWLLVICLGPLALLIMFEPVPLEMRLRQYLQKHPEVLQPQARVPDGEIEAEFEAPQDEDFSIFFGLDLIMRFPERKLPGAHLARDSMVHWLYALLSAGMFFGVLALLFPSNAKTYGIMLAAGIGTGTIGILLLITVQLAAVFSGVLPRGGGILMLFLLVLKFIGFSYQSALDPDSGLVLSFFGFTCGVGFCEELCKALPLYVYMRINEKSTWRQTLLIGLASWVGFGVSEGIKYSADYYNGIESLLMYLVRFVSCVGLHSVWAGSVAMLMHRNQEHVQGDLDWASAGNFVFHYLLIPMILHGLYDTLLKKEFEFVAFLVAIGSFLWWAWLISRQRAESTAESTAVSATN